MGHKLSLIELLNHTSVRVLDDDERIEVQETLCKTFCRGLASSSNQYKWHSFSGGYYPSSEGEEALLEYSKVEAPEYIVLPEWPASKREQAFLTRDRPDNELVNQRRDFYVFPGNMAWLMAFTHEYDWLGPYFARHEYYLKLQKKNTEAIEAKKKGWV